MKKLLFLVPLCILFCSLSECTQLEPYETEDRGRGTVWLDVDGETYGRDWGRYNSASGYYYVYPDHGLYKLDYYVWIAPEYDSSLGSMRLDILLTGTGELETGVKYEFDEWNAYPRLDESFPVLYASLYTSVGFAHSLDGWVVFRKIEPGSTSSSMVLCGDFEFTAKTEDGTIFVAENGTFDMNASYSSYSYPPDWIGAVTGSETGD